MKITLIVLGVLFVQMSLTLFIAQLIRAGRGPAGAERSRERDGLCPAPSPSLADSIEGTNGLAAMAREVSTHSRETSRAAHYLQSSLSILRTRSK